MPRKHPHRTSSKPWTARSRRQWLGVLLIVAAIIAVVWYFNRPAADISTPPTLTSPSVEFASTVNLTDQTTLVPPTLTPIPLPATINVQAAYEKYQQGAFFLDVREQSEWDAFHIPGTTWIPLGELESRLGEVPRDREIVVVCRSGNRSQAGRDILLGAGFPLVTSMEGGIPAWSDAGYPIEGTRP